MKRRVPANARRPRATEPRRTLARFDLSVRIGSLELSNPVLTASGTFGYGDEYAHVVPPDALGAVITKTVTLEPRSGNPPVRIDETHGGMLNSIGLENVGLDRFKREKLPRLRDLGATVVASIGGETPAQLARLLGALADQAAIAGFEINFSCPNIARGGARYWASAHRLTKTLALLRPLTSKPLIAKLSPDVTSIGELAIACEEGGADAVTAVNTFVGMAIDLEHRRSRLNRTTGGLSGPAIKPLALARCFEAARAVKIPVIGSGGIMSGRDALEFLAVGAMAVQVGTATFIRPRAALEVLEEMATLLAAARAHSVTEWRGSLAIDGVAPRVDPGYAAASGRTSRASRTRRVAAREARRA